MPLPVPRSRDVYLVSTRFMTPIVRGYATGQWIPIKLELLHQIIPINLCTSPADWLMMLMMLLTTLEVRISREYGIWSAIML